MPPFSSSLPTICVPTIWLDLGVVEKGFQNSEQRFTGARGDGELLSLLGTELGIGRQTPIDQPYLLGMFFDWFLQFFAARPEFVSNALALLLRFKPPPRLVAKRIDGNCLGAQLVITCVGYGDIEVACSQPLHDVQQSTQEPDKVAFDIEPDDRTRGQDDAKQGDEKHDDAYAHAIVCAVRSGFGEFVGAVENTPENLVLRYGKVTIGLGHSGEAVCEVDDVLAMAEERSRHRGSALMARCSPTNHSSGLATICC